MKFKLISLSIFCACSTFAQADMYQESTFDAVDFFDDFYGSEEMVAIATGTKTQIYKAPAVASVFTAEQIKNMGATDIDDVLEAVPGLHISRSANGYNPLYTFRGVHSVYNQQILMLINNIPITNSFAGNRNQTWGGMPVEAIARIEVIRGPGSAIYGADAFAGVINIITKNADDIKKNELSVRAGSDNTQNAWFTLGGNIGEAKYATIVEYHNTDGSDKVIEQDSQTLNDSLHGTKVSNAPGAINIPVESFDVRSEINWADFTLRAGLQKRRKGIAAGLGEALDPTSSQQSIRWNVDVNYYKQVNNNVQLDVQAAYFDTSQEVVRDYIIFPAGYAGVFTDGLIGNPEVFERHKRINITSQYSGFNKHQIRLGVGYHDADLYKTKETKNFAIGPDGNAIAPGSPVVDVSDTPYIFLQERDRTNYYAFMQDVWSVANDWELTLGIRHDKYSDFGHTTNPRIALVWANTLNFSTKLLYGKAFRAPSFVETSAINNPLALGNPTIQPEEIATTELAFDYHPGGGFGAIANFYRYEWDDIIQFVPDTGKTTSSAQNFGKQVAYGTELELNWQLTEQLKLAANYAWSKATNKTNDVDVAFVPEQQWYLQLDWKISEQVKLNIKNHLVQDRIRNQGDLRSNIDDYWLTDLTVRWTPSKQPFEMALIAKNVFDQDVREPSINNGAIVNIPNDLPQPGSMFLGEVRYHF